MKILVLGASGMLGNAVFRYLNQQSTFDVYGSVRSLNLLKYIPNDLHAKIISNIDIENNDNLVSLFSSVKPDLVINCIGLIKQHATAESPLDALPINAILPHRLANLCAMINARFIHMSTDCVFSGSKGEYQESDAPDAKDLYGRSY